MRPASYTDSDGRRIAVWLPDGVPDSDASLGIHRGPPPLESLGLPLHMEVALNNELFDRGLFEYADLKKDREQLVQAIRRVLSIGVEALQALYLESSTVLAHNQKMSEPGRSPKRKAV